VRRRLSTRWALIAAVAAVAACIVSPVATTASYTIVPGGAAVTVTVSPSGTTSNATFSGTAGQRISLWINNVTITRSKVSILKPNGNNLLTPYTVLRSGHWLDVKTLPVSGTYKIVVNPYDTYTGKMTLHLYNVPPDPNQAVVPGGAGVPVTTTVPGQNALFTFDGTAGQRVSVNLTSSTYTSSKLRIYNPDSTLLFPTALTFGTAGTFVEPKLLGQTGTYTIQVDPVQRVTGGVTVQVYDVPADSAGPITACTSLPCSPVTAATGTPGQNAWLSFAGTAGQRVSVLAGNSAYAGLTKVWILKPDASPLTALPLNVGGGVDAFIEPVTLPADGSYFVFVDPPLATTGSLDVRLFTVPADVAGAITPGTPLTASTSMPGQNAEYTFSGVANQRVSLNLTNVTYGSARVSILKPDLTPLGPALFVPDTLGDFLEPLKLPVTGTYRVKIDPIREATGSLDVRLYIVPADITGSLASGVTTHVSFTTPGQNATLTFSGTSGQRIWIEVENVTLEDAKLRVRRPDGTDLQGLTPFGTAGTYVENKLLSKTGTYQVWLDPVDELLGDLDITLFVVPADVTGTLANGVGTNVTTTSPGQNASLTFNATAGQRVFLRVTNLSLTGEASPSLRVKIYKPDGITTFASIFNAVTTDDYIDTKVISTPGAYKVLVDPQGRTRGSFTVTYYIVPADLTGVLVSPLAVNFPTPGMKATYTFSGTSGSPVTIGVNSGSAVALVRVGLKSPSGTELDFAYFESGGGTFTINSLPATGTYTVVVDPEGASFGALTLTKS
jgi:hypothetical protein